MSKPQAQTMFCHDPDCSEFNVPHEFWYLPTTYDYPSEWIDEPECRVCHGTAHESMFDLDRAVDDVVLNLPLHGRPLEPADRALVKAVRTYLIEKGIYDADAPC